MLPPFIRVDGPVLEARFKRKPDGSPDGSVHPLFVISGYVDGANDASGCNIVQPDFQTEVARGNVSLRTVTPVFGLGLVEQIAESHDSEQHRGGCLTQGGARYLRQSQSRAQ